MYRHHVTTFTIHAYILSNKTARKTERPNLTRLFIAPYSYGVAAAFVFGQIHCVANSSMVEHSGQGNSWLSVSCSYGFPSHVLPQKVQTFDGSE